MRLFGHVVARNEADRYLVDMLGHLKPLVDQIFLYDDASTDETPAIAEALGCHVWRGEEPLFLRNESICREEAWLQFEWSEEPEPGDWVLSLDADEVVVGHNLVETLRYELLRAAELVGAVGISLPIHEVFGVDGRRPLVRIDGVWGGETAFRLFQYQRDGVFLDRRMACGSAPTYVTFGGWQRIAPPPGLGILHFGYLDEDDRRSKYERYTEHPVGHNRAHIESILQPAVLTPWSGPSSILRRRAPVG